MTKQPLFDAEELLSPPVKRAAYSDRTAWLMAEMSRLAYDKFEGAQSLKKLAVKLAEPAINKRKIEQLLNSHIKNIGITGTAARKELAKQLAKADFSLVNIYNQHGTQAFLAKLNQDSDGEPMLVLAFRGTENNVEDIKTDVDAAIVTVSGAESAHRGFYDAFLAVKKEIEDDLERYPNLPIYITGHSLGGALAILGTRYLASDSLGACYTFGGPRVGNVALAKKIKTPIYRVVNAADVVPRLPPAWIIGTIIKLLEWTPLPLSWITKFLSKFRGYVHYGDMRYLTHVPATEDGSGTAYADLELLSNPSLPLRMTWLIQRWLATFGKAAGLDHSIELYCEKLKAHAKRRNK